MDGGWDGVYVVRWEAVMPKYVLKIEAVFEADKSLSRDARRDVVRELRRVYVEEGVLEEDVLGLESESVKLAEKPAPTISFEPQS